MGAGIQNTSNIKLKQFPDRNIVGGEAHGVRQLAAAIAREASFAQAAASRRTPKALFGSPNISKVSPGEHIMFVRGHSCCRSNVNELLKSLVPQSITWNWRLAHLLACILLCKWRQLQFEKEKSDDY